MSKSRCFALGCSYTRWYYATVADYVGTNFDEYRNLGIPGADHNTILNQLIWANEQFKFTSDDLVIVNTTNFGRFSYWDSDKQQFIHRGDIWPLSHRLDEEPLRIREWTQNFDSDYWAIYRSVQALKLIKYLLASTGTRYVIYGGVSNLQFQGKDPDCDKLIAEMNLVLDITETIDEHSARTRPSKEEHGQRFETGYQEIYHPSQTQHYRYFQEHFKEYDSSKSKDFYDRANKNMITSSAMDQVAGWVDFISKERNYISVNDPILYRDWRISESAR